MLKPNFQKTAIAAALLMFTILSCKKSETTQPVTTGPPKTDTATHIYISGYTGNSPNSLTANCWKDGVSYKLDISGTSSSQANCVAVNDTNLYFGGAANLGGAANFASATYWKNGSRTFLNDAKDNSAVINGVAFSVTDMYAVGSEITIANNKYLASLWKNGHQTYLTDVSIASNASSILINGNDIYVGGGYTSTVIGGTSTNIPAYWKNGVLQTLPTDVSYGSINGNLSAYVLGIAVLGSDVYACGYTSVSTGKYVATYWKNGKEIKLTDGSTYAQVRCIGILGSDVYMGGYVNDLNGNAVATVWKNGTPTSLTDNSGYAEIEAIAIKGNDIYLAGYKENSDKATTSMVYWKNGNIRVLPGSYIYAAATGIAVAGGQ